MPHRNVLRTVNGRQITLRTIQSFRMTCECFGSKRVSGGTQGTSSSTRTRSVRRVSPSMCVGEIQSRSDSAELDANNATWIHKNEPVSRNIAVIGAGAAGLVAARELLKEGHRVTILEQSSRVGGVWNFTGETEDDLLGRDPSSRIHWSMYRDLRTNLPREVMGFSDFPFDGSFERSMDPRRFPSHTEVLAYLKAFTAHFDLMQFIQFNRKVSSVGYTFEGDRRMPKWRISHVGLHGDILNHLFDGLIVCNGHYSEPRVADRPGMRGFPGLVMHSHNYREPEAFKGKRIVIIGASNSGTDIALEIQSAGATAVCLSSRNWGEAEGGTILPIPNNGGNHHPEGQICDIIRYPDVESFGADGSVRFVNGQLVHEIDVVIFATGYDYSFPFLKSVEGMPNVVNEGRVGPLYKHVFPCNELAPSIAFIGLPWKVVPFPQFELQSRWVSRCLSQRIELPSTEEMKRDTEKFYNTMAQSGIPVRYTHRMSTDIQRDYNSWLADLCGDDSEWPGWRDALYQSCGATKKAYRIDYRERELIGAADALQEFEATKSVGKPGSWYKTAQKAS